MQDFMHELPSLALFFIQTSSALLRIKPYGAQIYIAIALWWSVFAQKS